MMSLSNIEFVYYEPKKTGKGEYFGYGKIGKVFEDRREPNHYFAEVLAFRPFASPIPFNDEQGNPREYGETYNSQNAVRRVSGEILDGICLDAGIVIPFKADAHLVRVLGEELIANERVGILELIKNAYDAGASECLVQIENIPGFPAIDDRTTKDGPLITIQDNGRGMDRNTIENGWLRPASTLKTNIKERLKRERITADISGNSGVYDSFVSELRRQNGGRIPLGEKGVGRFATHRLGRYLRLTTKQKGQPFEFLLEIDWDRFESRSADGEPVDLETIGVTLRRQLPTRDYGSLDSGTTLIVSGGKPGFKPTLEDLEDLADSVAMLKSPYHGAENFEVTLIIPQFPNLAGAKLIDRFVPQFEFSALISAEGIADFELKFIPPANIPLAAERLRDAHFDLRKMDGNAHQYWAGPNGTLRKPACGEFFVGIKAWYRRAPWIDGPDAKKFVQYLEQYGGISVFRDGLNILPASWGSSHDWLQLSTRHIKKSTNISYYAMAGACEITQNGNISVIDKTDRQGLLENQAFKDLSSLVRNCVFLIENHYKDKRDTYENLYEGVVRNPKTLAAVSRESASVLDRLRHAYDFNQDTFKLFPDIKDPDEKSERILNLTSSLKSLQ